MLHQLYSSLVLHGNEYRPDHHGNFKRGYGLVDYYDPSLPAIFYGCYNKRDYSIISQHRSGTIVIWAGSDVLEMKTNKFKFKPTVRHIALSKFNQTELRRYGIVSSHRVLLKVKPEEYPIKPLGTKVYIYMPFKRRRFYGFDIVCKLAKMLPNTRFVLTRYGKRPPLPNMEVYSLMDREQMKNIYTQTLCCIRPTKHDGFPQTFLELGLMGRACAWPHEAGIAVTCKTINEYINFIKKERSPHPEIRNMVIRLGSRDFLEWF